MLAWVSRLAALYRLYGNPTVSIQLVDKYAQGFYLTAERRGPSKVGRVSYCWKQHASFNGYNVSRHFNATFSGASAFCVADTCVFDQKGFLTFDFNKTWFV
jgi:hypothetical protein